MFNNVSLTDKIAIGSLLIGGLALITPMMNNDEKNNVSKITLDANAKETTIIYNEKSNVNINNTYNTYVDKNKEINSILLDLRKIKVLLPTNVKLMECVQEEKNKGLKAKTLNEKNMELNNIFSKCIVSLEQNYDFPEWLINKNRMDILKLVKNDKEVEELVNNIIFDIRELVYEEFYNELWYTADCSDEIQIVKNMDFKKFKGSCVNVIEDYHLYKKSILSNDIPQKATNKYLKVGRSKLEDRQVKYTIIQKSDKVPANSEIVEYTSMKDYTLSRIEHIYAALVSKIEKLETIISEYKS